MISRENHKRLNAAPILSAEGISKRFGTLPANDSISLQLHLGKIHALLGENGAGKSTLVSILYGLLSPDAGQIRVEGKPVVLHHPQDAMRLGIGLVQQHFSLISAFSVLDNIILGKECGSRLRLKRKQAERDIQKILEPYRLDLPFHTPVESLPVGIRQQVEIAKILYRKARIMLFDEPTASLVSHEVERFLITLQSLANEGIAVLLITHRLPEVAQVADEVTVLQKGRVTLQAPFRSVNLDSISRAIVGEELPQESYSLPKTGAKVFQIQSLSAHPQEGFHPLMEVSLDIREREILGIAGVAGNGQDTLVDVIVGVQPHQQGNLILDEQEIGTLSPAERRKQGIALIPSDRREDGLLLDHPLYENLMLNRSAFASHSHFWLQRDEIYSQTDRFIQQYQIKTASLHVPIRQLSGGHQQRVILARELSGNPRFIVAYDPTRGLDVAAMRYVHETFIRMSQAGAAILWISSELFELFLLCHRIAVLYRGSIIEIHPTTEWTAEELGRAMLGVR